MKQKKKRNIKKIKKNIVNIIDTMNNKNTYISLFSSAGIGCYGFKKENFQCLATNEFLSKRMEIQKNNKVGTGTSKHYHLETNL
ncbi:hypothetical Protein pso3_08150 [Candidatus Phytoplasma solani]